MAAEITNSSLSDLRVAAVASSVFLELYLGPLQLPNHPALIYVGSIDGTRSDTITVPAVALQGYNRMAALGSETSTTANTDITDTSYSVVVAPQTLHRTVGDLARVTGAGVSSDPTARLGTDMAFSFMSTMIYQVCQVIDGFTAVVGTSGADMSLATFLSAQETLNAARAPAERICILHDVQWAQLQTDLIANAGGSIQFTAAAQEAIDKNSPGYKGRLGTTEIYTSDLVSSSGGNYLGGMWAANAVLWADGTPPVDPEIGDVLIGGKVKIRKSAVANTITTALLGSAYLGTSMGTDARGVTIRSTTTP